MTRNKKRRVGVWLGSMGLLVLLALAALLFPVQILCVDRAATKSDMLVLLGGGGQERPARAAELFHQGAASRILVTGSGDFEWNRSSLINAGVPSQAILVEKESRTTQENALFTVPLLRKAEVKHAIIVTSWFHSRRALACFRRAAPEVTFSSCPTLADRPKAHWPNKYERDRVLQEYAKIAYYWLRYGIRPF